MKTYICHNNIKTIPKAKWGLVCRPKVREACIVFNIARIEIIAIHEWSNKGECTKSVMT